MKTPTFASIASVVLLLSGQLCPSYGAETQKDEVVQPPSHAVVTITVSGGPSGPVRSASRAGYDSIAAQWDEIKDCSSVMRDQFFAGLQQLEACVDGQINELAARRATARDPGAMKEWELAANEMNNARFFLSAMGEKLRTAVPENWEQQKQKVGLAWMKAQEIWARTQLHHRG